MKHSPTSYGAQRTCPLIFVEDFTGEVAKSFSLSHSSSLEDIYLGCPHLHPIAEFLNTRAGISKAASWDLFRYHNVINTVAEIQRIEESGHDLSIT